MTRPLVIGLTGSIGMGKSTTASMFREAGIPVWDADAAVHRLYAQGGAGVSAIASICPEATRTGEVDREVLRKSIEDDPNLLSRIEAVIHPLVAEDRRGFLDEAQSEMVVVDVPLLFETGGDRSVDVTVVVSATADSQRDRVLARPGMTEERLQSILSRQMPDAEKRRRADFVIETLGLEEARRQVHDVIEAIKARSRDARDRSRY